MKKLWRCPSCSQASTRHWNLKRHIARKHHVGQPTLGYISGNSYFNLPASGNPRPLYQIPARTDPIRSIWRDYSYPVSSNNYFNSRGPDKWLDNMARIQQLMLWSNQLEPKVTYFPQPTAPFYNPFGGSPDYVRFIESEEKPIARSEPVTGFKAAICVKCLTTIILELGSINIDKKLQDLHKCESTFVDAAQKMAPGKYFSEYFAKARNLPVILFEKCKDWAGNINGVLYLVAEPAEPTRECQKVQIPENHKTPWLRRVLTESKIVPTDNELYEFLCLVRDETTKLFTFAGKAAVENLAYTIGVSIATKPIDSSQQIKNP